MDSDKNGKFCAVATRERKSIFNQTPFFLAHRTKEVTFRKNSLSPRVDLLMNLTCALRISLFQLGYETFLLSLGPIYILKAERNFRMDTGDFPILYHYPIISLF